MEEYTNYGKPVRKNIQKFLQEYKKEQKLTNLQLAQKCNISMPEMERLIYGSRLTKHGCSVDTLAKIIVGLDVDANIFFDFK